MITGNKIQIRAIKESELEAIFELLCDFDSKGPFLPIEIVSEVNFKNEFSKSGFVTENTSKYVIASNNEEIIGLIWVFESVPYYDALEIGYQVFAEKNRGKGYASEAVKVLVNHLFSARQINRVEIRVATGNSASIKIAENNGFIHEGVNRQAAYSQGEHHDMHVYSMLRSEWHS